MKNLASLVLSLLVACVVACGLWELRGLSWPADVDLWRDLGGSYSLVDGHLLVDHAYVGAVAWYPALLNALLAAVHVLTGLPLPLIVVKAGLVLNLLVPIGMFLFVRKVADEQVALAAAVGVLVMAGAKLEPWQRASYALHAIPALLGLGCVLITLWARLDERLLHDAVRAFVTGLIVSAIFLLHPAPALVLGTVFVAYWLLSSRSAWRTLGAFVLGTLVLALPYVSWLYARTQLVMLNREPSQFAGITLMEALKDLVSVRSVLAAYGAWCMARAGIDRRLLAFAVGALLLGSSSLLTIALAKLGLQVPSPLPPWHFYLYLKLLELVAMGFAVRALARWLSERSKRDALPLACGLSVLLFALHLPFHLRRHESAAYREQSLGFADDAVVTPLHRWLRANTHWGEVVLAEPWLGMLGVASAARGVVVMPAVHANPYVAREPREQAYEAARSALERGDASALATALAPYDVRFIAMEKVAPSLADRGVLTKRAQFGAITLFERVSRAAP